MKAIYVVNRLKDILPKYTDDFSTILNVSSLTRSTTTITCTTATNHGLTTGDYITIRGAKEPIALTNITFSNGIATATTPTDNKLSDPSLFSPANLPLYVEIAGASGYNGLQELVSVTNENTFKFKVSGSPSTVSGGYLLLEDQEGYNGYKQITVVSPTVFTYSTTGSMQSPAQGNIQVSCLTRIEYSATAQRIQDYYSQNSNNLLSSWLFVVMGQNQAYKDDNIIGDSSSAKRKNESYFSVNQEAFSIYIVLPSKDSTTGGSVSDTARSYLKPLLKALANYVFVSDLSEQYYQPCQYVGNEADDYIQATYTHRFDFVVQGIIQNEDTIDFNNGVPFRRIEATLNKKLDIDLDL
jgi:hypothetical protein